MASEARNAASAINVPFTSTGHPYASPQPRSWKGYWTRYWCFKSQKREKRIVPTARSEGASGPVQGWPAPAGLALAPPSSPASFINSSAQSPASFSLSLAAAQAEMCSPGPRNTMFMIGPYAHETQLVSPPVFSTFTTEPSTAPFTPPPELAHLTTPSSPDVPFAQYIASSLQAKSAARDIISPLSTSNFASPCDTPASYTPTSYTPTSYTPKSYTPPSYTPKSYTPTSYTPSYTPTTYTSTSGQLCLGSPVGRLISSNWRGCSGQSLMLNESYQVQSGATLSKTAPSFTTFHPFSASNFDKVPFAALSLTCDRHSKNDESHQSDTGSRKDEGSLTVKDNIVTLQSEKDLDLGQLKKSLSEAQPLEQWRTCYFKSNASDHQRMDDSVGRDEKIHDSVSQHDKHHANNMPLAGDWFVDDSMLDKRDLSPATLVKA